MKKYQERFSSVIDYIETHLDSELDIEKLCRHACLSKYHFHRQCAAFFGVPAMSLVKLLRFKRAAYQLAYRGEQKVVDIALASGYASHEAFCRAFRKHFNQTPSGFRRAPDWTFWHNSYEPVLKLRAKIMNPKDRPQVELVTFAETLVAVMSHRGSPDAIGTTINRFIQWRKNNRLPPHKSRTFNLLYNDPELTTADEYRLDLCCSLQQRVEENPEGIRNKVIPAGQCARIRHTGSDDMLATSIHYLYSEWLPHSAFELRDFPVFLERVRFFPDVAESDSITDIYLPIQ